MPMKQVNHFTLDLTIIKMRVKTVATKNDSYDVFVYTAKLGDDEFRFTLEDNILVAYDKVAVDVNITRETSKQKKLLTKEVK